MWMKPYKTFGPNKEVGIARRGGWTHVCVQTWDSDRQKFRYQDHGGICWSEEQAEREALALVESLAVAKARGDADRKMEDWR